MKKHRQQKAGSQPFVFPRWLIAGILLSSSVMVLGFSVYLAPSVIEQTTGAVEVLSTRIGNWKTAKARTQQAEQSDHMDIVYGLSESSPRLASAKEDVQQQGKTLPASFPAPDTEVTYTALLDTSMGPMLYYNQGDSRWADYLYGGEDPMAQYGCGPTAAAMLINSFSSARITPVEAADWASANGCHAPQGGSYHNLIRDSLTAYGFLVEPVRNRNPETVTELLESGHILVALMGEGTFTDNGHFILLTESLGDDKVRIADPNNFDNCTKDWELSKLLPELKKAYDHGAPLWAVSLPKN